MEESAVTGGLLLTCPMVTMRSFIDVSHGVLCLGVKGDRELSGYWFPICSSVHGR